MKREMLQRLPFCPLLSINDEMGRCIVDSCAWWSDLGNCCAMTALADAAIEGIEGGDPDEEEL